jgi:hypothetical protein
MENKNANANAAAALDAQAPPFALAQASASMRLPACACQHALARVLAGKPTRLVRHGGGAVYAAACHVRHRQVLPRAHLLPRTSYRLVSHLVEGVPTENSYNLIKEALMQAHQLSDYQRVELLSKVEPLGARKPSDLLAAMIELCPRQHLDSPFFL